MSYYNLLVRECVNAVTFGLFLFLTWRFLWARQATIRIEEPRRHSALTALAILCAGETIRSALAWFSLSAQTSKWPLSWVESASPLWMLGGLLISIGAVWSVHAFKIRDTDHGMFGVVAISAACLALSLLT